MIIDTHLHVIDQAALEALAQSAADGVICRPSDGAPVTSVAFVQCAGQRDDTGPRTYAAGTWGPAAASALVARDGHAWDEED